jgi:ankyrin repeat protein
LHLATEYGHTASLQMLLIAGGNPNLTDKWGKSVYDFASGDESATEVHRRCAYVQLMLCCFLVTKQCETSAVLLVIVRSHRIP